MKQRKSSRQKRWKNVLSSLGLAWLVCCAAWSFPAEAEDTLAKAFRLGQGGQWKDAIALARRSGDRATQKLVYWMYLRNNGADASFGEIKQFLLDNPAWPDHRSVRRRAEAAMDDSTPAKEVIDWFTKYPPDTRDGKMKLVEAYQRLSGKADDPKAVEIIRDIWRSGLVDRSQHRDYLLKYKQYLKTEDHIAHIDSLMWKYRFTAAKSLFHLVDADHQLLFETRMMLAQGQRGVEGKLKKIPSKLKLDPGLLFERMRWRANRRDFEGVQEILLIAPKKLPYPEAWWAVRNRLIRELASYKYYKHAYILSQNHGQTSGIGLAEAAWLAGWLSLVHMKKPGEAYEHFYQLYHGTQYPISKSRGAYWAGRAAMANGNKDIGRKWYGIAAHYSYTFYGQLAQLELNPYANVVVPEDPEVTRDDFAAYLKEELPQTVLMLHRIGEKWLEKQFVIHMATYETTPKRRAMAGKLGQKLNNLHLGVKAAKEAVKEDILLVDSGYPVISFPPKKPLELAMSMAITRQESEFWPEARSGAGALGLMQLLPSTAKETAKKLGMGYDLRALTHTPTYNLQLGSTYLYNLIQGWDGNAMLAVASYNAGAGRIRQYVKRFGDPSEGEIDPVLWVEELPLSETRNYVQRVLENLQIYRYKLAKDKTKVPLLLKKDLGYR